MKRLKKVLSAGLIVAMTASLLAGCSGSGGSGENSSKGGSGDKGRYVEQDYGWPISSDDENNGGWMQTIGLLSDGTIRALCSTWNESGNNYKALDSSDGGKTWAESGLDLSQLNKMTADGNGYINNIAMDGDGNLVFTFTDSESTSENGMVSVDNTTYYYFLSKDGQLTEIPMEIPGVKKTEHYEYEEDPADGESEGDIEGVAAAEANETEAVPETEEDDGVVINEGGSDDDIYQDYNGINSYKLADADNLYVMDYNGSIYHVSVSTGEIINTMDGFDYANDMNICGSSLIINTWDKVIEYDIESGKQIAEHEALAEIVQSSRGSMAYADNRKDDGKLYYASYEGIFAYNLKDDTSEQIVDGNMTSLFMPDSNFTNLIVKEDGDFLLQYSDYSQNKSTDKLLNYTYDAEMAKKPDKEITIYSLNENYNLRQVAALFQRANPDVYVNVEVGISGTDAVTTSDAIRTLNTEIMAGEGPDIVLLDGMPIDSYVEKGLLADVSDVVESLISEGKLFETVANTYKDDSGKICAVPTSFTVPIIVGKKDMLDQISSMADIAAAAEQFASEEHKSGQYFIEDYNLGSLIGTLMPANSAGWFKEDGSLDADSLKTYLTDVKTIYDSVYNTFSEEKQSEMDEMFSWYLSEDAQLDMQWFGNGDPSWDSLYILAGISQIGLGNMAGSDSLEYITSAMREDPDITYRLMPGYLENVYVPSNIIGVNSKSKDIETSKAFMTYILGLEGQNALGSYSGFPVNIEAFDKSMINPYIDEEWYDPNNSMGGIGTSDENGNEINLELYWPSDDDIATLKNMLSQLSTPAYNDNTILSTILNDCIGCILSDQSIDEAVDKVIKDINIYLSE